MTAWNTPAKTDCSCWVRLRPDEERFAIRFGAHNPGCLVFRPSFDPVDNIHDAEIRLRYEMPRPGARHFGGGPRGTAKLSSPAMRPPPLRR